MFTSCSASAAHLTHYTGMGTAHSQQVTLTVNLQLKLNMVKITGKAAFSERQSLFSISAGGFQKNKRATTFSLLLFKSLAGQKCNFYMLRFNEVTQRYLTVLCSVLSLDPCNT